MVVKWSLSGISYRQIIKLLNVSLGFISKWNNKFSTGGVKGLKMEYKGKPGYLSKSEKAEIVLWLSQREMWDLAPISYLYRIQIWSNLSITTPVTILYLNQLKLVGKSPKRRILKETPNW